MYSSHIGVNTYMNEIAFARINRKYIRGKSPITDP